ncbi:MAG: YdcF family protein [Lachnospiraceae bacterium]|nr:YdcF family protein [Lachnospiraceae bacterium]
MLVWIFSGGALVCLAYFVVIILYSGLGTNFAYIWLMLAAGLGVSAGCVHYYGEYPEKIPLRLPVTLITLCAAGAVVMILLQIMMFGRIPAVAEPDLDYLIVLGAQVKKEGPSKTLRLRLDKAAEYARQNPDTILILSGGQGSDELVSEAQAMQDYLAQAGISRSRTILENRSTSTVENIAFSRILIEEQDRTARVGILTSNFHLYRARKVAAHQGMQNISYIASESDRILFLHFCIRDGIAILKERIVGNL